MRQYKKWFSRLILFVLIWGITNGYAQKNIESAKAGAQRFQQQFSLSKEQALKLETLNKTYAEKLNTIKASSDSTKLKGDKMMQLFQQKEAELKALLTQEQYNRYLAFKEANRKPLKKSEPVKKTN